MIFKNNVPTTSYQLLTANTRFQLSNFNYQISIIKFIIIFCSLFPILYSQDQLYFFNKLIDSGFYELANEWINEEIDKSSDTDYIIQLKILLTDIGYKKVYNLSYDVQLKEFLSKFKEIYNGEISKMFGDKKEFSQVELKVIESFFIRTLDFVNYYDNFLKDINKNALKLQQELNDFIAVVFTGVEDYIKKSEPDPEIRGNMEFYALVLKFFHFKFSTQTSAPQFDKKLLQLEKELDDYYMTYQPSILAYEMRLIGAKLLKIKLDGLVQNSDSKGIKKILSKIKERTDEVYNLKDNIEGDMEQTKFWNALVIRSALFKVDMAIFQFKNDIGLSQQEKTDIYNEAISVLNYINFFPNQLIKLEAKFRKAQLYELNNNVKEAIPLYYEIAKSQSFLSNTAQSLLRKYQHDTTISTEDKIIEEFGRVIASGDYKKVMDFYHLYMKKTVFFGVKYRKILIEFLASFLSSSNHYLENSILNYFLFSSSKDNDDQGKKEKEIRLSAAILSLQDYVNTFKEESDYFSELLIKFKEQFSSTFPKSDLTQSIMLKDIKVKIQEKNFAGALDLIKQAIWSGVYENEANILKTWLELRLAKDISVKTVTNFIKSIKPYTKNNLYLLSLSSSLLSSVVFDQKHVRFYKLLYRYSKYVIPALKENKDLYLIVLEDAVKSSFLAKKYKDFELWIKEYVSLNVPPNLLIDFIKNYFFLNASKFNRKKAKDFFALYLMSMKRNKKYTFTPDFAEKISFINLLLRTYEYDFDVQNGDVVMILDSVCKDIEKESDKVYADYLIPKIIPAAIAEDKDKKRESIAMYKQHMQGQCLGLKYRFTHDKKIIDALEMLYNKNNRSTTIIRELSFVYFIILKKNLYDQKDFNKVYEYYKNIVAQFYNLVKGKPQSDKSRREAVLFYIYSAIISGQKLDKVKDSVSKLAKEFNMKDTRKLYKIITRSLK